MMTPHQKRTIRAASIHVVFGVCAILAQIGISVFLFTTPYWPLGAILLVCNMVIRKTDVFMDALKVRGEEA